MPIVLCGSTGDLSISNSLHIYYNTHNILLIKRRQQQRRWESSYTQRDVYKGVSERVPQTFGHSIGGATSRARA